MASSLRCSGLDFIVDFPSNTGRKNCSPLRATVPPFVIPPSRGRPHCRWGSVALQTTMNALHTVIDSPVGELTLVREGSALTAVYFAEHVGRPAEIGAAADSGFEVAIEQLGEYFAGQRTAFDLELSPHGDEFQQRVWMQLRTIPYGQTRSYGEVATALGDPNLSRAVGSANGRNPLSIIVPCHRVIGADGSLTGYGGGLARKAFLLELEEPAESKAARLF